VEEDEIGVACSMHGRDEKIVQKFSQKALKGRDHLKDLYINVRIILNWILKKYYVMNWTGFILLRTGTSGGIL
jgi:hypothetical protein